MQKYKLFLKNFDEKLEKYKSSHQAFLCCQKGCSICCEKGEYPISELELKYLMHGYIELDISTKIKIQENIKNIKKGEKCPFLINNFCSIYEHRPIICRVHGLAYLCKDNLAKLPYCVNLGKNYKNCYKDNELLVEPIKDNLETYEVLKDFDFGPIKNLYDWIKHS